MKNYLKWKQRVFNKNSISIYNTHAFTLNNAMRHKDLKIQSLKFNFKTKN